MNTGKDTIVDKTGDAIRKLNVEIGICRCSSVMYHVRTGRPLGTDSFIARLEKAIGCILRRQKPGQKGHKRKIETAIIKYGVPRIAGE